MHEMLRRFVILGHRARTAPDFSLNDLCGGAGRLDNLARCVSAAFFLSHTMRTAVEVRLILLGEPIPPVTVRFDGAALKHLNPDERSTAARIKKALEVAAKDFDCELGNEVPASEGVFVSRKGLKDTIDELTGGHLLLLDSGGTDIRDTAFTGGAATFVLSDDVEFSEEERALIERSAAQMISLGPHELHAAHCITLVHNELDRKNI